MQHPDEGTIHAWLDGQLPHDEAAAIEAHVAECRPCADAVAEARGLIAASSRILMALDDVPRGVTPKVTVPTGDRSELDPAPVSADAAPNAVIDLTARVAAVPPRRTQRRWLSAPSLAAAAAVIIAVGSFAVVRGRGDLASVAMEGEAPAMSGPSVNPGAPISAPSPAPAVASAPASPPALGSGRAANQAASASEARSLAAVERAERRAPDAAAVRPMELKDEVAATAAKTTAQIRSRNSLSTTPSPKEAEATRAADAARQKFAAVSSVAADSLARKVDTNTVTIIRGRDASVARAPAAAPLRDSVRAPSGVRGDVAVAGAAGAAATGEIRGRVTDGNGTGIEGAMVTVLGSSTGVATDRAGQFALGGVSPGQAQLSVRRLGYVEDRRTVAVAAGQSTTTDVILSPVATSLSEVVVTGAASGRERRELGSTIARAQSQADSAPGAAVTATQSRAIGCYELGITSNSSQPRTALRQVPRRVALDSEIVPANADGIWYRARDLARTGALPNGLWRPVGTNGVEIEWLYGNKLARIRLMGPVQAMRGTIDEIDRAAGINESGTVVSSRRSCQ